MDTPTRFTADRRGLILVDSCEHMVDSDADPGLRC